MASIHERFHVERHAYLVMIDFGAAGGRRFDRTVLLQENGNNREGPDVQGTMVRIGAKTFLYHRIGGGIHRFDRGSWG